MAGRDPRGVIIEHLIQPSAGLPPVRPDAPRPGGRSRRPVASLVSGNPFTADRSTVQFVKERGIPGRRLYAVTFDDEQHNSWFWLVAAERERTGWVAVDVAGGSGRILQRSEPRLNLCGSWGQGRVYAGGDLHTAGASIGEICLTLTDGTQLTDDAQANVALFLSDRVEAEAAPATVEIYDTNRQLLASHAAF